MDKSSPMPNEAFFARMAAMLDRQEILDCQTRAFHGADRLDQEIFCSAFHADAEIDLFGRNFTVAELFHEIERGMQGARSAQHYMTNNSCEIDGDTAHTETYQMFIRHNLNGTNRLSGGRVFERFERRDGAWKIAFRYVIVEWSGSLSEGKPPPDGAGIYLNGGPSWNKDDVSYRRPLTNRRN